MKKETEYFFKMPFSIVENEDLSITDKFLFGIVLNLTNKTGTCTASNAYIADRLKLSTKTIERSFKSLRDNGFIETINIYENGTKRIVRRNTKIVPSKMSFDTLNLSNSTLKNEDTLPSEMSFDTLKNEGDKKINIKEDNKRDKGVFCESKDSLIVEPTSEPDQQIIDEVFNYCWDIHSNRLKQLTTKDGNPRKNGNKGKTKQRFVSLLKKYSMLVLSVYVKNSTFQTHPKEFINLIGRDIDKCLLDGLSNIEDDQLEEMLDKNYDKKSFLYIIEQIEEQI